jgi:hypothetical protein
VATGIRGNVQEFAVRSGRRCALETLGDSLSVELGHHRRFRRRLQ